MKIYLLTDKDFEELLAQIDRDPTHGTAGGSTTALSSPERREEVSEIYRDAYRFYNYHIRRWLDGVKK